MKEIRELVCIGCPLGCQMQVELIDKVVTKVTGNTCKRGEIYGEKECTNPTRIITSSVEVEGGEINVVSVKTKNDIPKDKIFQCIELLKGVKVKAPIKNGDILVKDIANTGVDIIATRNVLQK